MEPVSDKEFNPTIRVGIDIGGTFTDFVIYDPESGSIFTFKLLSTPGNPAEAVLQGLKRIRSELTGGLVERSFDVIHGSTVATNALLERKGAKTALVTTKGFADILEIGRQDRPALYDFFADPPAVLVPVSLRFEADERVAQTGNVLRELEITNLKELLSDIVSKNPESIAVCLLFSFLYPHHEQMIAEQIRRAGFFVSISSDILPEFREFERASTTTVNAYVTPILDRYLSVLERSIHDNDSSIHMRVMQSNGGSISLAEAREYGVRCILSGPAGGVIGSQHVGSLAKNFLPDISDPEPIRVITFDMGGTSTDVSLIEERPQITTESIVGGCPIRIPILDIHTIGAGGGSIAYVDAGGALRVGPQSAGADPGPACYGKGDLPTVTDANLVLGRLIPSEFLGGAMELDENRAWRVMGTLGEELGLTAVQTASGVVRVANAHMERALRVISVERGHDPRQFTLLSFGGASGLHCLELARLLGISRVLVPPMAATLSAYGMLAADIVKDFTQTVMLPGDTAMEEISTRYAPLIDRADSEFRRLEFGPEKQAIIIEQTVDIRYLGQSYELGVPYSDHLIDDFHKLHQQAYGYSRPGDRVELVNLRVRAVQKVAPPVLTLQNLADCDPSEAWMDNRPVVLRLDDTPLNVKIYRGEKLRHGNQISGPALVVRSDTTIFLNTNDQAQVDGYQNLWIEVGS